MDFYAILGIDPNASDTQVRAAYRAAAVKYHPDKNMDQLADAETRFKMILEAYQTLIDPRRRRKYDRTHRTRDFCEKNDDYNVVVDEMGIVIHDMALHALVDIDDAFESNLSSSPLWRDECHSAPP